MRDVRAVDWLPLDRAVDRLSRGYERAFLANVGPIALEAAFSGAAAPIGVQDSGRRDVPGVARDRRDSLMRRVREWLRRII